MGNGKKETGGHPGDDHGAELEDLAVHVAGAAGEAAPVGEDHEGEVLPAVEVVDRLRSLVRRVVPRGPSRKEGGVRQD